MITSFKLHHSKTTDRVSVDFYTDIIFLCNFNIPLDEIRLDDSLSIEFGIFYFCTNSITQSVYLCISREVYSQLLSKLAEIASAEFSELSK